MEQWKNLELEDIKKRCKNVHKMLMLPLFDNIIKNKIDGTKLKSNRNSVLGSIPEQEKDRAFGFLIKSPSLMTR